MCTKNFDDFDAPIPKETKLVSRFDGVDAAGESALPSNGVVPTQGETLKTPEITLPDFTEMAHQLNLLRMRIMIQLEKGQLLLDQHAQNMIETAD